MTTTKARVLIGISGWHYAPWRGVFYPEGLRQARELEYASRMLPPIEINGSFYSLQRPESYAQWHDDTPPGFVFAVKGPKFITHMRRLKDVRTPLANFFASGVFELRDKLGPILWQFPPQLAFEPERFESFFEMLPRDTATAAALAKGHDHRVEGRTPTATRRSTAGPSAWQRGAVANRWRTRASHPRKQRPGAPVATSTATSTTT